MVSKLTPIASAVVGLMFSFQATAGGIPVYCFNCAEATYNSAHSILDAVRTQTEALLNGMDYVMRTQESLASQRDAAMGITQEKIKNSQAMDPSLGAKPRSACGQYGAASLRGVSSATSQQMRDVLAKRTRAHNRRGRNLAPGEPRADYNITEIINLLDDPEVDVGKVVLANNALDVSGSELEQTRRVLETVLNPFPVEMPSEEDIERIKARGTPGERANLAQTLALQRRQEVGQYIHDQEFEKNIKRLDPSVLEYMLNELSSYLSADQKKMLAGKISPNQLDELMATYRVRSEEWVKQVTTSPSAAMAAKEQLLISAEILNQLWEIKGQLVTNNKLLSFSDVRDVSQQGMQSR